METVGPYQILEPIGRGGMGVVYRALDPRSGEEVAVKTLPVSLAGDPESRARLRHEAEAASRLCHPNVVRVWEHGEDNGTVYLAMQLVRGVNLATAIARAPRGLPVVLCLRYGRDVARALRHAHARGVLHRDVKASNVLLDAADDLALVCDFGLAHATGQTRVTPEGTLLGTPATMAPEQMRGEKSDARSDVYAFGMLLHQMLVGRLPFEGLAPLDVVRRVMADVPVPSAAAVRTDLPRELSDLMERCVEKSPERRPAAMAAVLEALNGLAAPLST